MHVYVHEVYLNLCPLSPRFLRYHYANLSQNFCAPRWYSKISTIDDNVSSSELQPNVFFFCRSEDMVIGHYRGLEKMKKGQAIVE